MNVLGLKPPTSPFDPPSLLWAFLVSPLSFLARSIHAFFLYLRPRQKLPARPIRIVCISDTHSQKKAVPEGDLLIHAGDLTNAGTVPDIQEQIDWLHSLPHTHKVVIAGNHDTHLDPRSRRTLDPADQEKQLDWKSLNYLQHSSVGLTFPAQAGRRLKVYGAPQIPACGGLEFAFQYARGQDAWTGTVPRDVDVLVTHTPPRWHLDLPAGLGCEWLLKEVWRVRPRLHVFGHIHGSPGTQAVWWDEGQAACERICERNSRLLLGLLSPATWVDFATLVGAGIKGVTWTLLWGGTSGKSGIMVNAAQMWDATQALDSEPSIIML